MHLTTDTHRLSLNEDGIYELRRTVGADAWLDTRRGDAFGRTLTVRRLAHQPSVQVQFEGADCGRINLGDEERLSDLAEFVRRWNDTVAPTDLTTAKTAELLRAPDIRRPFRTTFRATTWNAAGNLGGNPSSAWRDFAGTEEVQIFCFQESDRLDRNYKANTATLQTAVKSLQEVLPDHTMLASTQLLGLMTIVFVHRNLASSISQVTKDSTGTGFLKMWGNKGAVMIRLRLHWDDILGDGIELVIVNCHLSAGEGRSMLGRRRWELSEIGKKFGLEKFSTQDEDFDVSSLSEDSGFNDDESAEEIFNEDEKEPDLLASPRRRSLSSKTPPSTPGREKHVKMEFAETTDDDDDGVSSIIEEDPESLLERTTSRPVNSGDTDRSQGDGSPLIILLGDLNYRVLSNLEGVRARAKDGDYDGILRQDTLNLERNRGSILKDFEEPPIGFPPTYKYDPNSGKYTGRVPSYTDRILYRTELPVAINAYEVVDSIQVSDHRPVTFSGEVRAMRVDEVGRAAAVSRALRLVDAAENRVRPRISVDPLELHFKGSPISMQTASLSLRSLNPRPIKWEATVGLSVNEDHDDIKVHPSKGELKNTEPVNINVQMRIPIGKSTTQLLSIKPVGGTESFIALVIEPLPSVVGSTSPDPKAIHKCVAYLWTEAGTNVLNGEPEMAIASAIVHWLDNDEPFDTEVFNAAEAIDPGVSARTVLYILLEVFTHLPTKALGPNRQEELPGNVREFLKLGQHLIDTGVPEKDVLDAWAKALYDGPEPHAYIKSAMLVAFGTPEPPQ